ncbi:hypothetical protein [Stenotrophomonas sp. NA06056]|uniref:hypothetical protein n=1 Tax=Stenotrophomonas sp. NA06056 TaxID=2742129 RepID=UPI00158D78D3|nr:hypothetical protein [Stenotrophomonas sp. NA06056]QKW57015.1 hypothetical protein HUT07_10470 [Stenotrophomonas sp. NA06056]
MSKGKFDWIYDIDASQWSFAYGKKHHKLEVADLLQQSGLEPGSNWEAEFAVWAATQSRKYQALPMVNAVTGKSEAVTIMELNVDESENA